MRGVGLGKELNWEGILDRGFGVGVLRTVGFFFVIFLFVGFGGGLEKVVFFMIGIDFFFLFSKLYFGI